MSPLRNAQTLEDPVARDLMRQLQRTIDSLTVRVSRLEANRGVLDEYSDKSRPRPEVQKYKSIFNTDDGFINVSDGDDWLDPTGAVT